MASIVNQIETCFKAIARFGDSRHEAKLSEGRFPTGVFGHGTFGAHLKHAETFGKWCRDEFGVKLVKDIKPWMGDRFLRQYIDRGQYATAQNYRAAMVKLAEGLKAAFGYDRHFFSKDLKIPAARPEATTRTKPYSLEDADRLVKWLETHQATSNKLDQVRKIITVIRVAGLRNSEARNLKVGDLRYGTIVKPMLTKEGHGHALLIIGKGGKERLVEIPRSLADQIRSWASGKNPGDRLFNVSQRTVQEWVQRAVKELGLHGKGVHGLRATWAVERMLTFLVAGLNQREAENRLCWELGHGRKEVLRWYIHQAREVLDLDQDLPLPL